MKKILVLLLLLTLPVFGNTVTKIAVHKLSWSEVGKNSLHSQTSYYVERYHEFFIEAYVQVDGTVLVQAYRTITIPAEDQSRLVKSVVASEYISSTDKVYFYQPASAEQARGVMEYFFFFPAGNNYFGWNINDGTLNPDATLPWGEKMNLTWTHPVFTGEEMTKPYLQAQTPFTSISRAVSFARRFVTYVLRER